MNERTYTTPLGKIHYWVHLISPDGVTLVQRLRHVPVKPYDTEKVWLGYSGFCYFAGKVRRYIKQGSRLVGNT